MTLEEKELYRSLTALQDKCFTFIQSYTNFSEKNEHPDSWGASKRAVSTLLIGIKKQTGHIAGLDANKFSEAFNAFNDNISDKINSSDQPTLQRCRNELEQLLFLYNTIPQQVRHQRKIEFLEEKMNGWLVTTIDNLNEQEGYQPMLSDQTKQNLKEQTDLLASAISSFKATL